jgi:hypothetical protein
MTWRLNFCSSSSSRWKQKLRGAPIAWIASILRVMNVGADQGSLVSLPSAEPITVVRTARSGCRGLQCARMADGTITIRLEASSSQISPLS